MKRFPLPLLSLLLLGLPAAGQGAEEPSSAADLAGHLSGWRGDHGSAWRVHMDRGTDRVRMLYGGSARSASPVRDGAGYERRTREVLRETRPLLGVDEANLALDHVRLLPLAQVGTSDKVSVQMRQEIGGVPVWRGWVNALYLPGGTLVALDSKALPELGGFDVVPTLSAEGALRFARTTFRAEAGVAPTTEGTPELFVVRETLEKGRVVPRLAWKIELWFHGPSFDVEAWRYFVAADGAPRVVARENLVHELDVGGQVVSLASPGTLPDTPSNPPAAVPMAYMTVTSPAGTTTTDASGNFNFPGVTGPLDVTFQYEGTYNDVQHDTAANYVQMETLTGTGNLVTMNSSPTEDVTAQSNAFHQINVMRDWTRSVDPADGMMDFVNDANVMIEFRDFGAFIITNCNAVFDGVSTNYWWEDGGCVNTAYSTVIHHEQGHWQNERYGSGNGGDGFGEGNADVFSMYINDTPVVGEDFTFGGGFIRTGLNTRQYCGDGNGGCYGGVHDDGEVLMGALWKVRDNLDQTHGNAVGDAIADQLFSAWMNGFNQGSIHSIIETQWLMLDDDDGNIGNGTPNYEDIDDAFLAQGFPGFELTFVDFQNVVQVEDTLDEAGPYGVAADLAANQATNIVSADLVYRVNGGSFLQAPMSVASGNTWTVLLPGVSSPAKVEYYIEATDDLGNDDTLPKDAPAELLQFVVGEVDLFFEDDFETPDDNGWTHQQVATQDDWQHDEPNGASGSSNGVGWTDPDQAFSGQQVWGNDLAPSGFNGAYQPNVENFLLSPALDLSGAVGTRLQFKRWLTVEEGVFDQAEIRVNGATVWSNPGNGHVLDTEWTDFEVDISAEADGDPSVQIEWRLTTDGGLELGGWNIDDVCVSTLDSSPTVGLPTAYGAGIAGTNGSLVIDSAGQPAEIGNSEHVVAIKNALPGASAFLLYGSAPIDVFIPILGGNLLILAEDGFGANVDIFGQAHVPFPIPADMGLVGQDLYVQGFVADPAPPGPFATTQGLQITIVDVQP